MWSTIATQIGIGLVSVAVTTLLCVGQAAWESSDLATTASAFTPTMEASCGWTIATRLTTMACTAGAIERLTDIFEVDGALSDLKCSSAGAMQASISGTGVPIQETDGVLCVHIIARGALATGSLIAMVSSGRMHSTSVKEAGART